MELFSAHQQWSTRPADQRFETIKELYDATKAYARTAGEKTMEVKDIRTEAVNGEVQMVGKKNNPARLTHWSFGQLSARVGAPASYLRDLPATLAAQNLNHGLAKLSNDNDDKKMQLLFHQNGDLLLRAFTSEEYSRIWNWEVAERLMGLQQSGWTPATPDLRFDGGDKAQCQMCDGRGDDRISNMKGEPITKCVTCKGTGRALPALYASDHDMYAFVRNNSVVIKEPGNADGLQRGLIVSNSEVGAAKLKMQRFLYRKMCGNHIIWGASKLVEIAIRHTGNARERFVQYDAEIRRYADTSASEDEQKIASARRIKLGNTKQEVLDKLFGMRSLNIPMKTLEGGYDANVPDQDGDPKTQWGLVQGLTRFSQSSPYADQRMDVDKAAGKLMEVDF